MDIKTLARSLVQLTLIISLSALSLSVSAFTHDEKSAAIADRIVENMGGRENYDKVRYVSWNFFGKRFHIWDKHTGDIRIEYGDDFNNLLLMNIHSKEGKLWEDGVAVTDAAKLNDKMGWGYKMWINDSYWLVMPFKLHDPGVNITYAREDLSLKGKPVDVLTMTFEEVGVTPNNKYELFVDKETQLISEFAFYPTVETEEPRFRMPWTDYQTFGKVLLADNRGNKGMAPVGVYDALGAGVMSSNTPAVDAAGNPIAR